jgi:group II intron reverse transcriptase/maturase
MSNPERPPGRRSRREVQIELNGLPSGVERIRQAACRDKRIQFTALWHHVYELERLRSAYLGLKRDAAPGIDGETWREYGKDREKNLQELSDRLQRGAYRAKPVRRAYIPKPDGRKRPLGVTVLEDKIVQRALVEVLNGIYETDFLGFSYGFRPGRSPHAALNALMAGIMTKKVSWVLDADIRGYFDTIDHEWLVKFVQHRVTDQRVTRHIRKWMQAGVLEEGNKILPEEGVPQGGSICPLLANIYLHYVLDLWADQWRRKQARGDMIIVRFADDFIVGFQYREEAIRFGEALRERFHRFGLELNAEKTRLLEFGRYAAENRAKRGQGKPETFDFLGFTHSCGRTRNGKFVVNRRTIGKRMRGKLKVLKAELGRRLHHPIPEIGQWLRIVLLGHYHYFGVPGNYDKMGAFRYYVSKIWHGTLQRRSQRSRLTWDRMSRLISRWLPSPRIYHPYPDLSRYVITQGRSPVR